MVISTTLLVSIGTSVSKRLISLWMSKDTIENDVASNLSDYSMTKAASAIDARSAGRTFTELGERIAESLVPLLEAGSVDDNGVQAVAHAVSETIGDTSIRVMIDANMDPDAITAAMIKDSAERTALFSTNETNLYERCIRLCVIQMTGLVAKSPEFVGAALSDLMRTQSALVHLLSEIRDATILSLPSLPAAPYDDGAFEEQYRRAIVENLDRVDLFGLDLRGHANKRQKLSVAYTGLSSSYRVETGGDEDEEDAIVPIEQLITSSRLLLIGGEPGSGKTTLLRWIAIRTAQNELSAATADPANSIPFYIPFRQCSRGTLPGPEEFVRFVAPSLAGAMPSGWVHKCLAAGRGTILLDSVDEIPRAARDKAYDWFADLRRTYPRNQYIITSRPYALSGSWEGLDALTHAELQPMEVADIYDFIDRWHLAVENEMQDKADIEELEATRKKLKIEVDRNLALRHIATNPLLCAALCALNRDRHQKLPTDRIEIYDAFCDMLLGRRDIEQDLDVERTDYPRLNARQKKVILEDLSYYMLRNGWVSTDTDKVEERIRIKLQSIPNLDATASDVLRLFIERSGIIREPGVGEVDFTHRTLQEFLSARAIINENDTGVLMQHAGDDRWREVIILAAGLANAKKTESIVSQLMHDGDRDTSIRYQRHLLAVACLDTAVELGPTVQARVKDSLAALIPPATLEDARMISAARDLAVPYLFYKPGYTAQQSSACIRALSLIATDASMEALKSYRSDARPQVLREVIRATDSFPAQKYFTTVLSHFNIKTLDLKGVRSLRGIESLVGLESLSVTLTESVKDASSLAHLTTLKKLVIACNNRALSDYSFVAALGSLEVLVLEGPLGPSSLECIRHLSTLQHLSIHDCTHIRDYSPLRALTNLRTLEMERCDHLADLSCFGSLQNVEKLIVRGLGSARDLTPLSRLPTLLHLELLGLDRVFNLAPLRSLTQMRTLIVGRCRRTLDLSPLGELTHMTRLRLTDVYEIAGTSSLARLVGLESLEVLCASGRHAPLDFIAGLRALRTLQLHGFPDQDDISFLKGARQLQALSLVGFDQVTDIGVLGDLPSIESMYVSGFKDLGDISPLRRLSGLRVNVLIPPSSAARGSHDIDGWGIPVRGGLKAISLDTARRHGFGVYSLDRAISLGLLVGRIKIIEARHA